MNNQLIFLIKKKSQEKYSIPDFVMLRKLEYIIFWNLITHHFFNEEEENNMLIIWWHIINRMY